MRNAELAVWRLCRVRWLVVGWEGRSWVADPKIIPAGIYLAADGGRKEVGHLRKAVKVSLGQFIGSLEFSAMEVPKYLVAQT